MSGRSLERERQAILERMNERRETYRRMLNGGEDIAHATVIGTQVASNPGHAQPVATYAPTRDTYPRSAVTRVISEHPVVCALGVAAVIVIGPKRIARTVINSGTAVAALTANNQSQIDLIGRLLTMAGAYVQGRTHDRNS
jgi:hypothetical protein